MNKPTTPMKESGIPWIGQIPQHWIFEKIRYLASLKGRIGWQGLTSNEYQSQGPYLITGVDFSNGKIDWSTCVHITEERWAEAPEIHIRNGDLLITKDGTVGKVAIVKDLIGKASLNSGVLLVRLNKTCNTQYLYWVLLSDIFWGWFREKNAGNSTIIHLYQRDFSTFNFPVPPLAEQEAIAAYLDRKCGLIQETIARIKKQVELLKTYRQSLISETVTRGLTPGVPMKESGIPWIGQIPQHWEVKKLKRLATICNGQDYKHIFSESGTYPVYGSGGIFSHATEYLYTKTSVLLGRKGTVDKPLYVDTPFWTVDTMYYTKILDDVSPRLFYYLCMTIPFGYYQYGSAVPSMTQRDLNNNTLPVPPLAEQEAIAAYLDRKCGLIDQAIEKKASQVEKLAAYQKALIFEAVTGRR